GNDRCSTKMPYVQVPRSLWDSVDDNEKAAIKAHVSDMATSVSFSGDGKLLAAAATSSAGDKTVWLLDTATGKEKAALTAKNISSVNGVALNGDGTLLTVAADNILYLWDIPATTKSDR